MIKSSGQAPLNGDLAEDPSQQTLSAKEKFDACMKLAEYFLEMWESRRGFEWKIAFGLWTLLGAATVTLRGKGGLSLYMVVTIVLVFEFGWLWNLWSRSDTEKRAGKHYRDQAEQMMKNRAQSIVPFAYEERPFRHKIWEFAKDWSMQFQLIVTALLAWAAYHFNHIS